MSAFVASTGSGSADGGSDVVADGMDICGRIEAGRTAAGARSVGVRGRGGADGLGRERTGGGGRHEGVLMGAETFGGLPDGAIEGEGEGEGGRGRGGAGARTDAGLETGAGAAAA